jgi:hypothetical protein
VQCCLSLVEELAGVSGEVPVMLVVDDYNALYGPTGYGKTVAHTSDRGLVTYRRQMLQMEQLNLVRGRGAAGGHLGGAFPPILDLRFDLAALSSCHTLIVYLCVC